MSVYSTLVKITGNRSHTTVMVVRLFMCGMFVTTLLFYCLCAVYNLVGMSSPICLCAYAYAYVQCTIWLECPHLYAYVLVLMCSVQFGWNVLTYTRLTFTVSI